jgi:hypothetical protein
MVLKQDAVAAEQLARQPTVSRHLTVKAPSQ